MELNRRRFLQVLGVGGVAPTVACGAALPPENGRSLGVLVDIPNCIGCRKCEFACQRAAGFETPGIEAYDDKSVFEAQRRPSPRSYTTVNRFPNPADEKTPFHLKANCLHCREPACVSACLVGALRKEPSGAVIYDAWKCMGCRYCMVACPFQIPAYEYDHPLTPQVRKCNFCADRISESGGVPACVQICPRECLIFGPREQLLEVAHQRIKDHPGRYVDHVYGEHEAGGTAWMYLSSVPFEEIGLPALAAVAPSQLTETIQHGIFRGFFPPLALYGLLALIAWLGRGEMGPEIDADAAEEERIARIRLDGRFAGRRIAALPTPGLEEVTP